MDMARVGSGKTWARGKEPAHSPVHALDERAAGGRAGLMPDEAGEGGEACYGAYLTHLYSLFVRQEVRFLDCERGNGPL